MCLSSGSDGEILVELAPSFTALWKKELLMLAGDVEPNPGPYTPYGKNSCDISLVNIKILGECRTLWGKREQAMHLDVELFCS